MTDVIQIEEKYSGYWTLATLLTTLFAAVLFLLMWNIEDPYWAGISRFGAFISFSAAVICSLKVMEGKHTVRLAVENSQLIMTYLRKGEEIKQEVFELSNLLEIRFSPLPSTVFSNEFFKNDLNVQIYLKDSDRPLNLFELDGRVLSVNSKSAGEAAEFLKKHAPGLKIP